MNKTISRAIGKQIVSYQREPFNLNIEGKEVVEITLSKMLGMLYNMKSNIVTIHTLTNPHKSMNVKDKDGTKNPYIDGKGKTAVCNIKKYGVVNGLFAVNYKDCVNKQLDREGKEADFVAEKAKWGIQTGDSKVLQHHVNADGDFEEYFSFNPRNYLDGWYQDFQGNEIDKEKVEPFVRPKSTSSRQGTDKEVVWRTYKIKSLVAVSMDKKFYVIKD